MPCTTKSRARHIPQNVCPDPNTCCDVQPSFSSKQVCCGDDEKFDVDWIPYDVVVTGSIANPSFAGSSEAYYKLDKNSVFVKINATNGLGGNAGNGIYRYSLPPIDLSTDGTHYGTVVIRDDDNFYFGSLSWAGNNTINVWLNGNGDATYQPQSSTFLPWSIPGLSISINAHFRVNL